MLANSDNLQFPSQTLKKLSAVNFHIRCKMIGVNMQNHRFARFFVPSIGKKSTSMCSTLCHQNNDDDDKR
jgi:hypothetical protein